MKTMLRNLARLFVRIEEILSDLGSILRIMLHPYATRRLIRYWQQQSRRRALGNQRLATENAELRQERNRLQQELEQALAAQSGKGVLDRAWADAAGVAGPEAKQP